MKSIPIIKTCPLTVTVIQISLEQKNLTIKNWERIGPGIEQKRERVVRADPLTFHNWV